MTAVLRQESPPSEVCDSASYNRLQLRRAMQTRYESTAETPVFINAEMLRVLIVDDCHDVTDSLSMLISAWGHDVRRAYCGASALALATTFQPDVLLIDIAMPRMNGLELALQVRQQASLKDCLMVAVTGCTDAAHRLQCEQANIDLFFIKPVVSSALESLLEWECKYLQQTRQSAPLLNVALASLQLPMESSFRSLAPLPFLASQEALAT